MPESKDEVGSTQDIDAGIRQRSPAPDEPHRPHVTKDRGGVYARERVQDEKPVRVTAVDREAMDRSAPVHPEPDDPAAPGKS